MKTHELKMAVSDLLSQIEKSFERWKTGEWSDLEIVSPTITETDLKSIEAKCVVLKIIMQGLDESGPSEQRNQIQDALRCHVQNFIDDWNKGDFD